MVEQDQLRNISEKLDVLIKLTAINVVSGKSVTDQIDTLDSIGLKPTEISKILGKPPNTITGIIARLKKRKKRNEAGE